MHLVGNSLTKFQLIGISTAYSMIPLLLVRLVWGNLSRIVFLVRENQGVELDLPQADAQPLPPSERRTLVLDIDRSGQYYLYLAGDPVEIVSPEQALSKAAAVLSRDPQTPVLVKADTHIDYGTVVQAMAILQQAGAAKVGLSTQPLPEN